MGCVQAEKARAQDVPNLENLVKQISESAAGEFHFFFSFLSFRHTSSIAAPRLLLDLLYIKLTNDLSFDAGMVSANVKRDVMLEIESVLDREVEQA